MKGKFFQLIYHNHSKIIQAEDTFDEYCLNVARAFLLPLKPINNLTGSFMDESGFQILITNNNQYSQILDLMPSNKITTLIIELRDNNLFMQNTQSEHQKKKKLKAKTIKALKMMFTKALFSIKKYILIEFYYLLRDEHLNNFYEERVNKLNPIANTCYECKTSV